MKLVNKVVSFTVLTKFEDIKADKIYSGRPTMSVIKIQRNTIIIFKNLRGRIMGNPDDIDSSLLLLPFKITNIAIQTLTYTHTLPHEINLLKLSHPFHYEGELFPSGYIKFHNCHVNIFHTGNLVLTEIRSHLHAIKIINTIESLIIPFYVIK